MKMLNLDKKAVGVKLPTMSLAPRLVHALDAYAVRRILEEMNLEEKQRQLKPMEKALQKTLQYMY